MTRVTGGLRVLITALLVVVLAGLTACSSGGGKPRPSDLNNQPSGNGKYQGWGLDPAQPRPSFTLTDTAGKPWSMATDSAGRPTFLFFGYTRCPDVCPTTLADIHTALTKLSVAEQKKVVIVFVTTDIKHDTPAVIKTWLANFSVGVQATFVGLTGTQAEVDAAQTAAHVTVASDGGQTHSAEVLLYGADDYARVKYLQSSNEAQQMAHDIPLVSVPA